MTGVGLTGPAKATFRLNTASVELATTMLINDLDKNCDDISDFILLIGTSTSSIPGHVKIEQRNNPSIFVPTCIIVGKSAPTCV